MSRNIKEIGKELMGKSLNSFHRKTGLTQLEENNKMQDGILDGILSQVDDAYIEKTEQSNVIHLDGSGDGVVVLDSIEGNTMVNLWDINKNVTLNVGNFDNSGHGIRIVNDWVEVKTNGTNWVTPANRNVSMVKPNTLYTVLFEIKDSTYTSDKRVSVNVNFPYTNSTTGESLNESCIQSATDIPLVNGISILKFTTREIFNGCMYSLRTQFQPQMVGEGSCKFRVIMLEGDWTDKEIPIYFEGLQSSFEEKVNDEGKYEIEILMNNENLWDGTFDIGSISTSNGTDTTNGTNRKRSHYIKVKPNTTYTIKQDNYIDDERSQIFIHQYNTNKNNPQSIIWNSSNSVYLGVRNKLQFTTSSSTNFIRFRTQDNRELNSASIVISYKDNSEYTQNKQNKIKLLINEPLRGLPRGVKDRLCVIENKLMIERNCSKIVFDGTNNIWQRQPALDNATKERYCTSRIENVKLFEIVLCNTLPSAKGGNQEVTNIYIHNTENRFDIQKLKTDNRWTDVNSLNNWFKNNPTVVIYPLAEPYYEEVLNEYGEPILLEGYENGTIYIDSTIIPTTTVRYTPKMESFKTLKEVNNNNIMLTNDVNDNIIPYMMDVDLMIMEKEMALPSKANIRTMEVLDMTSMQKRTQDMLERLIKGKTLTEQECKTRITTYLNAGKITDTQAEELNFLIDEIYA